MSDIAASILAKLKNKAKNERIPLQQLLNLFCQEEFIRRLSESKFKKNLILKGGFLLYAISEFTTRPTIDADYLLKNYSNDLDAIEVLVGEIISLPNENDFIKFEIRGLGLISGNKEYHGIRVNLMGNIGRTRTPFNIDFGVGDIVVPSPVERTLPVLLAEFRSPKVLTYSLESIVAEKLDAIILLMEATGRMKDFYDIYYLATAFDFDGRKLQEAIFETLSNRGTPYENDSITVIARLTKDTEILRRWDNFCKRILRYELDFDLVVKTIIEFTSQPYNAVVREDEFFRKWNSSDGKYV